VKFLIPTLVMTIRKDILPPIATWMRQGIREMKRENEYKWQDQPSFEPVVAMLCMK